MTIHLVATPPNRARLTAAEFAELDRIVARARREDELAQIRAGIRPGILRARRRHAVRRWLSRAFTNVARAFSRRGQWR